MEMVPIPALLAEQCGAETSAIARTFANAPELDPDWAERHPDRALAFLFVLPHPCEALERLFRM